MKQVSISHSKNRSLRYMVLCLWLGALAPWANASESLTQPGTETQRTVSQARSPLTFNVWLDERSMGTHQYHFEDSTEELRVISEADFNVKVMFVTVFGYQHKAIETWAGNCLTALESETVTNGESESVKLEIPESDCAGTFTYWDKQRLQRPKLMNAQTAQSEPASWTDLGPTKLPTIGKRKNVRPLQQNVSSIALQTTSAKFMLYYNASDELLMMQTDNDGRTITYLHDSLSVR